jgi:hypothetical protein
MVHAERIEQVLTQIIAQRLAADRLDQLSYPVDADAVLPKVAEVGEQRLIQRPSLAMNEIGKVIFLESAE